MQTKIEELLKSFKAERFEELILPTINALYELGNECSLKDEEIKEMLEDAISN